MRPCDNCNGFDRRDFIQDTVHVIIKSGFDDIRYRIQISESDIDCRAAAVFDIRWRQAQVTDGCGSSEVCACSRSLRLPASALSLKRPACGGPALVVHVPFGARLLLLQASPAEIMMAPSSLRSYTVSPTQARRVQAMNILQCKFARLHRSLRLAESAEACASSWRMEPHAADGPVICLYPRMSARPAGWARMADVHLG